MFVDLAIVIAFKHLKNKISLSCNCEEKAGLGIRSLVF